MEDEGDNNFLIVSDKNGGVVDLFKFMVWNDVDSGAKFLESGGVLDFIEEEEFVEGSRTRDGGGGPGVRGGGGGGVPSADHRWVIVVSVIVRKIIKFFGRPMELAGLMLEFVLNLLSLNGSFLGLIFRFLRGNVVIPQRGSETFISAIGHLDGRINLLDVEAEGHKKWKVETGNRALMDLCIMAAKLAYENAKVVRNVVNLHWKMHFVDFYNCWNNYQNENSTQVFIASDKPDDADLILVSFRGTEPFDADDWITDFDYSWYEVPEVGKIHMGFIEALGLGNRANTSTFQNQLMSNDADPFNLDSARTQNPKNNSLVPEMRERSAYYIVRAKLKEMVEKHKNAKFVVTGHSLGGALAILFPIVLVLHKEEELLQRLLGVYTFGQPRVGNRQLGRYMEARLEHPKEKFFRVVYCNDLVPRLPYDNRTFLYKHFGVCLYYNSLYVEQVVVEEPNLNLGLSYLIPAHVTAVWELIRGFVMGYMNGPDYREGWESIFLRIVGLMIPGLSAHSPVDYVNSVRLGRMRAVEMRDM